MGFLFIKENAPLRSSTLDVENRKGDCMDKYDLKVLWNKGKAKADITRTRINRKLEDTSFSTVFGKQLTIHCGVAIICIALMCSVCGTILNLQIRNDMNDMITDTAMALVDVKSQDLSITQDMAKANREMSSINIKANNNGFVYDSVCVLYNITNQSVEQYTSIGIQSQSDRLNEWYQEQTGDAKAEPVFKLPESLQEFAEVHKNKNLVATSLRLVNNVVIPETVEARVGKNLIDVWSETEGLDPNRLILKDDCPILITGIKADSPLLGVIASHKFVSDSKNNNVIYDEAQWPANIHIATKQFSINNVDYEVSLIYEYAGLRPIAGFLVLASAIILGVAIITSLVQTKKIREF